MCLMREKEREREMVIISCFYSGKKERESARERETDRETERQKMDGQKQIDRNR